MAFNIMNVSNIEAITKTGLLSGNLTANIFTVAANSAVKIKKAYFWTDNYGRNYQGYDHYLRFRYNINGTWLQAHMNSMKMHIPAGYSDVYYEAGLSPDFKDVWIQEGEKLDLGTYDFIQNGSQRYSDVMYTISYEIWT